MQTRTAMAYGGAARRMGRAGRIERLLVLCLAGWASLLALEWIVWRIARAHVDFPVSHAVYNPPPRYGVLGPDWAVSLYGWHDSLTGVGLAGLAVLLLLRLL